MENIIVEQMVDFFLSFFASSSALGVGLAVIFGAVWLAGYWPPLFKKPWLWAVLAGSAFLTLVAIAFIQFPLQASTWLVLNFFWDQEILVRWLLLAAIPSVLLSGLVQEGAKLVPVVVYWWRKGRNIEPKLGLAIGAMAGVGFGVFEAQWIYNSIFASGWSWETVQTGGIVALAGFWERFFVVAGHIAFSALAGYGLAKGWGWQFYLIASFLHAFVNYGVVFLQSGLMTSLQGDIYTSVWAVLATGGALWLRWRKSAEIVVSEVSPA